LVWNIVLFIISTSTTKVSMHQTTGLVWSQSHHCLDQHTVVAWQYISISQNLATCIYNSYNKTRDPHGSRARLINWQLKAFITQIWVTAHTSLFCRLHDTIKYWTNQPLIEICQNYKNDNLVITIVFCFEILIVITVNLLHVFEIFGMYHVHRQVS